MVDMSGSSDDHAGTRIGYLARKFTLGLAASWLRGRPVNCRREEGSKTAGVFASN